MEKGLFLKVDSFHQIQLGTVYRNGKLDNYLYLNQLEDVKINFAQYFLRELQTFLEISSTRIKEIKVEVSREKNL